ncbi:MAG: hypothetical protein MK510_06385 [SAR324 cluster bacterium]|nr:hypothetical protein [SAR324 cluster bacterium]
MAQAEKLVLKCLEDGAKQKIELKHEIFTLISLERLLLEMSSRQKLIRKEGDCWSITEMGRICSNYSERSE